MANRYLKWYLSCMKIKRMHSRQARDKLADIMRDASEDGTVTILTRYNLDHVAVVPIALLERLKSRASDDTPGQ